MSRASALRKSQTDTEKHLWHSLRNRQLAGFKFRRQHLIATYIVDFVCLEHQLVVELDGEQHAGQQGYDIERTRILNAQGFKVLRFWNNEVFENLEGVLSVILRELPGISTSQSLPPHPNPLPLGERE
jgi:very-short-patch-repair endonuclease